MGTHRLERGHRPTVDGDRHLFATLDSVQEVTRVLSSYDDTLPIRPV